MTKSTTATGQDLAKAAAPILTLDDFASQDTADIQIIPPGFPRAIGSITFYGPSHPKSLAVSDEAVRKARFEAAKRATNNRYQPPEKTMEEISDENATSIIRRIAGWHIVRKGPDGVVAEVPFTEDAAKLLLLDPRFDWLFGACINFLGSQANFIATSAIG